MIKVNDVTHDDYTTFNDLKIGDYFMGSSPVINSNVIWKKINKTGAVQITDDKSYVIAYTEFDNDIRVFKIKIISIDYIKIK